MTTIGRIIVTFIGRCGTVDITSDHFDAMNVEIVFTIVTSDLSKLGKKCIYELYTFG